MSASSYRGEAPLFELRQLRFLVAIADTGQLTRAAQRAGVGQPALSQATARLERRLGVRLFARRSRGVELTAAGEAFVAQARVTLAAADRADAVIAEWGRGASGRLCVGLDRFVSPAHCGRLFEAFLAARPGLVLAWRDLDARPIDRDRLAEVDVALLWTAGAGPGAGPADVLQRRALRWEPRTLLIAASRAAAGRPSLALADALEAPMVDLPEAAAWQLADHRGGAAPPLAGAALTVNEARAMIACGAATLAVPASAAAPPAAHGLSAVAIDGARPAVLELVWRRRRLNPLVDALAGLAEQLEVPRAA